MQQTLIRAKCLWLKKLIHDNNLINQKELTAYGLSCLPEPADDDHVSYEFIQRISRIFLSGQEGSSFYVYAPITLGNFEFVADILKLDDGVCVPIDKNNIENIIDIISLFHGQEFYIFNTDLNKIIFCSEYEYRVIIGNSSFINEYFSPRRMALEAYRSYMDENVERFHKGDATKVTLGNLLIGLQNTYLNSES